jgi:hypothetical protein
MNSYRVMHLFRHLTCNAVCPHCSASVYPECVQVDATLEDSAFLSIYCPGCNRTISAHVYVNLSDPDILSDPTKREEDISTEEIEFAHLMLKNHTGSVSELFSR